MLVHARMKRAALAVALVAASSGVAAAGGYIGLGIGTGPAGSVEFHDSAGNADDRDLTADGRSYRFLGGMRFGRIAVEGALGKMNMRLSDSALGQPFDTYQLHAVGKYHLPLGDGFEVFGKLGLQKTWFNNSADRTDLDASGTGVVLGAGVQYRLTAAGIDAASLFIDYQYSRADTKGEIFDWGGTSLRMWTLGATIGF